MANAGLDPIDNRILELLVEDGRRSASEIGRIVHLSPAAAKRRIDRLEEIGYIRGYTAILDHAMLGGPLEAFSELRFAPGLRSTTSTPQLPTCRSSWNRSPWLVTQTRSSDFVSQTSTT